jgi:hypothetical protein
MVYLLLQIRPDFPNHSFQVMNSLWMFFKYRRLRSSQAFLYPQQPGPSMGPQPDGPPNPLDEPDMLT